MNWFKSESLLKKKELLKKLVSFYPEEDRTYFYYDFYKLTNYTLQFLLKEKEGVEK